MKALYRFAVACVMISAPANVDSHRSQTVLFASSSSVTVSRRSLLAATAFQSDRRCGNSGERGKNDSRNGASHRLSASAGSGSENLPPPSSTSSPEPAECCIKNFRPAAGLQSLFLFRCGSTDDLATYAMPESDCVEATQTGYGDRLVYANAGLVIDMRSDSERDQVKTDLWTSSAPNGPVTVVPSSVLSGMPEPSTVLSPGRTVLQIDVLSPRRFMNYISENWLTTPKQKMQSGWYKLLDGSALHALRIDQLNQRGLAGLNEAILETGRNELCLALRCITVYLERQLQTKSATDATVRPVVFHCVKGKDRTGMLAMLLQSVMGVSESDIIADYAKSNEAFANEVRPTAAMAGQERSGRLDKTKFAGTNSAAMVETLDFLKLKYGSVTGYLDEIGFDDAWRRRLVQCSTTLQQAEGLSPPSLSKL